MKTQLDALRAAWQARSTRERSIAKALALCAALAILILAWYSLQAEQARLQKALPLAQARLQRIQDDADEVARLRAQSIGSVSSPTAEAIVASLQSRHLGLAISAHDSNRLQVQGDADFDETISWLALVHQDFRVRLETLSAVRAVKGVKIDAMLVAVPSPPH